MFHKKIKTTMIVEGMRCEHCVKKVKEALEKVNNIKKVKVMLKEQQVITFSITKINEEEVRDIIKNLGYEFVNIVSIES